ncbi:hypothetical protein [Parasitella parasitica]|uniref:Uncharacterized protein n=1 Tax=Parasitella parasitica TaxID=35722 RepID=A0A0B7N3G5_9FUNG|nr:hypothetical protein [Parasitella parasitica]
MVKFREIFIFNHSYYLQDLELRSLAAALAVVAGDGLMMINPRHPQRLGPFQRPRPRPPRRCRLLRFLLLPFPLVNIIIRYIIVYYYQMYDYRAPDSPTINLGLFKIALAKCLSVTVSFGNMVSIWSSTRLTAFFTLDLTSKGFCR